MSNDGQHDLEQDVVAEVESLLDAHVAKCLQRNEDKQSYYDKVALWMQKVRVAKRDNNLDAYHQLAQQSPSVRRRLELVKTLEDQGEPTDHLEPLRVLSQHPELVAGCATDCYFQTGIFYIDVKAASTNIARAAAEDARKLRSLVYLEDKDKIPNYTVRLRLSPIDGFDASARRNHIMDRFSE